MAVQLITGTDDLGQVINKNNNNAKEQIINATYSNSIITLTKFGGGIITVNLPIPNTGGQVLTSIGSITLGTTSGLYNKVMVSPITYLYNGVEHDINTTTTLTLTNGDATNNRIDAIYIDSNTNTVKFQTGTPANPPTLGALTSTDLLIGAVYVKALATSTTNTYYRLIYSIFPFQQVQTTINNGTPIVNLKDLHDVTAGSAGNNQVLTYQTSSQKWIPTDKFANLPAATTSGSGLTSTGNKIRLGGTITQATNFNLQGFQFRFNNGANTILDVTNFDMYDSNQKLSIDWSGRGIYDGSAGQSIQYNSRLLRSIENGSIARTSLDWGNRTLNNTAGNAIADWKGSSLRGYYNITNPNDLTTKAYVDSISGGSATNGLTKTNGGISLGGKLSKQTKITGTDGVTIIDFTNRELYDSFGLASIDWTNYKLSSPSGAAISWNPSGGNLYLKRSGGTTVLDFDQLKLKDFSGNDSVDWGSGKNLIDSSGTPSVSWDSRLLNDSTGTPAIVWSARQALNSAGQTKYDWDKNVIYSSRNGFNNATSGNFDTHTLYSKNQKLSIDWENRVLDNASGSATLDWNNRLLKTSNVTSLDWNNRQTFNHFTQLTIDYDNLILYNGGSSNKSLDWGVKRLYDSSIVQSLDWRFRTLQDSTGTTTVNWSSSSSGMVYSADYSANYTSRSLVDKGYLDTKYGIHGKGTLVSGTCVIANANITTSSYALATFSSTGVSTSVPIRYTAGSGFISFDTGQPTDTADFAYQIFFS